MVFLTCPVDLVAGGGKRFVGVPEEGGGVGQVTVGGMGVVVRFAALNEGESSVVGWSSSTYHHSPHLKWKDYISNWQGPKSRKTGGQEGSDGV